MKQIVLKLIELLESVIGNPWFKLIYIICHLYPIIDVIIALYLLHTIGYHKG